MSHSLRAEHIPRNLQKPSALSLFDASSGTLQVVKAGHKLDLSDLEGDPIVMFQRDNCSWLAMLMCFILPGALPHLAWGESFWNGMWVAGGLRYVVCLHATFLVNSAAHFFGHRPYDEKSWPGENAVVAFLTIGEGWHNW